MKRVTEEKDTAKFIWGSPLQPHSIPKPVRNTRVYFCLEISPEEQLRYLRPEHALILSSPHSQRFVRCDQKQIH
ncbi:hypothetical protein CLAIMM_10804 [Cladophialophora immunda]|nr:hypothetical protein CLAIMM_10804 [Cladophialophora immunda]